MFDSSAAASALGSLIRPSLRKLSREIGVFVIFLGLSIAMTWPLAVHLERAVQEPSDPLFTVWAMDWDYYATFHRGVSLFDANIFHPAKSTLAFSEHMYGLALLFFPLFTLGVPPLTIHNIALLLGFAVSGYAAFALCRLVTGRSDAALVGGIAYAFLGFRFHHLTHLHFVWSPWLPLMLLAILGYSRRPTLGRAGLLTVAVVMNGLNSVHWLAFGTVALVVTVFTIALATQQLRSATYWRGLVLAGLASLVLLWPFIKPYQDVRKSYGMERGYRDVITNSAYWRDWLAPNLQNQLYSKWSPGAAIGHERTLFPGFVILFLSGAALLVRRDGDSLTRRAGPRDHLITSLDVIAATSLIAAGIGAMAGDVDCRFFSYRGASMPLLISFLAITVRLCLRLPRALPRPEVGIWVAITWVILGALGARGLRGWFHSLLFDRVSGFRGLRMPARWSMIAYTGLAILVAIGMLALLRNRSRTVRTAMTIVVAALMLFELRAAPIRWYLIPLDPRPVYEWLATTPLTGGVVEIPIGTQLEFEYLWRATVHHKRLLNGSSSYFPADYQMLRSMYETDPIPESFTDALEKRRCSIVIVHAGGLARRPAVREWLRSSLEAGRLIFLRRFDAGSKGDYVFALPRIEPDAARWRAPEIPDPAGHTPLQNLDIFIRENGWTYNGVTFGQLDIAPNNTIRGRLTVLGWALSPFGIDHVNIHVANHRVSTMAMMHPRPDVSAALPFYPRRDHVGFAAEFAGPPRGAKGPTDMQVEIVDGRGRRTFLNPSFFNWYPTPKVPCIWDETKLDTLLLRLGGEASDHKERLMSGTESVRDVIDFMVGDADYETDLAFVERVVPVLIGHRNDRLSNWCLEKMARGRSRERILDDLATSREFAAEHLRGGAVTVD